MSGAPGSHAVWNERYLQSSAVCCQTPLFPNDQILMWEGTGMT